MEPQTIARPSNRYANYHAHVYFGPETVDRARSLCVSAGELFDVEIGRVHKALVGPHPHWSCQIAFDSAQFDALIEWLEQNRNGLNILVHGLTGDDLEDHTTHAAWLGNPSTLNLGIFDA
ncbi:DOPA 4,5-dioxygenase family protein [Synechococcus sp. PCC 7336]|uniref:DOPA 4,5-dioxygenase family protein n=1 Tax=Synechococcus sp. PCC 7336 TaxID=195250 RepID=UPI000364CBCD|nr:DOPA 4,5-dioxygenase family protein [Synechococcus sp. PCC 7336]